VNITDTIIRHYRELQPRPLPSFDRQGSNTITNHWTGLGDTVMLTSLPLSSMGEVFVTTNSSYADALSQHAVVWTGPMKGNPVNVDYVRQCFQIGNGHLLQRLERVFDLCPFPRPEGCLGPKIIPFENRVILHFEPGGFVEWQRQHLHPDARRLLPVSKLILETFIEDHPELDFINIACNPEEIRGARHIVTPGTHELIETIGSARWFIGILSGPLHVATALGLNCITLMDYPAAQHIILPTLVDAGVYEMEWLYPQNMHLHQTSDGPLCRRLSLVTMEQAFNGEIYPFGSPEWLPLIFDKP